MNGALDALRGGWSSLKRHLTPATCAGTDTYIYIYM
jgi:hypothetical protein